MSFGYEFRKLFIGSCMACSLVACGGGGGGSTGQNIVASASSSNIVSVSSASLSSSSDSISVSSAPPSNSSSSLNSPSSIASSKSSSSSTVALADTLAPTVSLTGESHIEINQGGTYLEAGATAHDAVDGELVVSISGVVDTSRVGEYTITYSAIDKAGNSESITRLVSVIDVQPPAVSLLGEALIVLYVGDSYLEQGATAHDAADGDLTTELVTSGQVDTSVMGSYIVTYSATDLAGHVGSATREVIVKSLNYGFQFVDNDLVLYEGAYEHSFELTFDSVESKERTLDVSISNASTASEGADFEILTRTIVVPANSQVAYVKLAVNDDEDFEGAETIVLSVAVEDFQSESLIELNDATMTGESHANLSMVYFNPMSVVDGGKLVVSDSNKYEVYDLLTETTSVASSFFPGIESGYGDAIGYLGDYYVFSSGKLYRLDAATGYSLISESPWFMEWTSELQVIGDELYVIAGRTSVENSTNQVVIYNFVSGEWRLGAPLNHVRYGAATAVVDEKIYVFGGNYGSDTAEVFDPAINSWSYISSSSLLGARFDTAVSFGKYVTIVVSDLAGSAKVLRFDTELGVWTSYNLSVPSRNHQDSFIFKGRTYFIGGSDNSGYSKSVVSFYLGDDAELYAE